MNYNLFYITEYFFNINLDSNFANIFDYFVWAELDCFVAYELRLMLLMLTILDFKTFECIIKSPAFIWNFKSLTTLYMIYYLENYYQTLYQMHKWFLYRTNTNIIYIFQNFYFIRFIIIFFKLNHYIYLLLILIFSQSKSLKFKINITFFLNKLFIFNESEKELGAPDDYLAFMFIFLIVLLNFVLFTVLIFIIDGNILTYIFGSIIIIIIFIISIPLNVFYDFSLNFIVYVKGSSVSSNIIIEILFDIIAVSIVIIRFIIQNIRFIFIFGAIFELYEWIFYIDSNTLINQFYGENIFNINIDTYFEDHSINIFIVSNIMVFIYYLYYVIHLIFLLFVQLSIYILISLWLFFFLYTSFFLTKTEKFLIYKKYLKF